MSKLISIGVLVILMAGVVCAADAPSDPWSKNSNLTAQYSSVRDIVHILLWKTGLSYSFAQPPDDPDDYYITGTFPDAPLNKLLEQVLTAGHCVYTLEGNTIYIADKSAGRSVKYAPAVTPEDDQKPDPPQKPFGDRAKLGDISVSFKLYTRKGAITAGEPLIAKVAIANKSDHPVALSEGNSNGFSLHISVVGEKGKLVAETPVPHDEGGIRSSGIQRLAPGEADVKTLILTGLYSFTSAGTYTIRMRQLDDSEDPKVLAERSEKLRVLPYNARQLAETLAELYAPINEISLEAGKVDARLWDIGIRSKALMSVRDEMVLPYLEGMTIKWNDGNSIRAMLRLNSEQAKAAADKLASRSEKLSKAAESARTMGSRGDVAWDMNWY